MNMSGDRYVLVPAQRAMMDDAAQGAVVDLRGIFQAFRRRWSWIVVPAVLSGAVALVAALAINPRYEASTKVLLDPRGNQILQNDLRPNNPTGDETGADVDSQVQVIASTSLLSRVVEKLNLTADPEFVDPPPGLSARLLKPLHDMFATAPPPGPRESPMQTALRTLQNDMSVRRSEKTFVIDISVRTSDPEKSVRIANAIADAYVRNTSDVRSEAARRSSAELSGRLEELRKRVQRSAAAVEDYRKKSDLVSANGRLVKEQQLSELNGDLTAARTRAADQQARVAEIQRMGSGGKPADAMAEVANSATMIALRGQLTEATRAEADARMNYGSRHPSMQTAEKQVQIVRQRIAEEVTRLTRTAQSDYERAKFSETAITRRIEVLKRENSAANEAQVRLRELERQATADRSVYESFLNRAKDLDERQALANSNAQVITQAVAPLGRSGISRALIIAGGLGFGAIMGLGLALLRDQADRTSATNGPNRALPARTPLPMVTVTPSETTRDPAIQQVRGLLSPSAGSGPARLVVVAGLRATNSRARLAQVLALVSNNDGERTLLIDGDFANRTLTQMLHAGREPGFTDVLAMLPEPRLPTPRSFNGLQVVTAGTHETSAVTVNVRSLRQALAPYLRQSGIVIVDAGSISESTDGFAALADDILVVVEGGAAVQRDISEALEALSFNADCVRGILIAKEAAA
ncbi:GumC family protein [Methylobacterium brachythecii]|uniref:LPS biosynthesis protein n=1 Tax=Methylobacterium brachythecii TaxID=1176177 RepID=A0A7W6F6A3_9HYPH|nr:exopolysaccharide transport family protein [Methylobacterium brachythecii]MBB3902118.1 uncharacterized protein involved in exopolysaccharide biosynthesis/Mrp family chromosome partitioning ATPase [Methylobacterium brachythecii]GLS44515.1 LPS biosynthesis protein [Methylobacterium brachythecii]